MLLLNLSTYNLKKMKARSTKATSLRSRFDANCQSDDGFAKEGAGDNVDSGASGLWGTSA